MRGYGNPTKNEIRDIFIHNLLRKQFGPGHIKGEYWTLGGPSTIQDPMEPATLDNLAEDCEINYLLKNSICKPEQIHSIENDPDIHKQNVRFLSPVLSVNWYFGNFDNVAQSQPTWKPRVIHYDATSGGSTANRQFIRTLLRAIEDREPTDLPTLVILAVVLRGCQAKSKDHSYETLQRFHNEEYQELRKEKGWAIIEHWPGITLEKTNHDSAYKSERSGTDMGVFTWWLKST